MISNKSMHSDFAMLSGYLRSYIRASCKQQKES